MTNRYKDMRAAVSDMFITLILTTVLHTWVLKYVVGVCSMKDADYSQESYLVGNDHNGSILTQQTPRLTCTSYLKSMQR